MTFLAAFGLTFIGMFFLMPMFLFFVRLLGLYTIVEERRCVMSMCSLAK